MASTSDKTNGKLERQKGIIEQLNAKVSEYKTAITRALSEEEIAKYNAKLQDTQKDLARLNLLGKVFEQTSVKVKEQTGLIGQLSAKLKDLKTSLQQATTEKQVEKLNVELAQTTKELNRITSLGKAFKTNNVQVQEQTGLIGKLNLQLKELKVSLQKATSEEEVARLNSELSQTSAELARINSLGKNITGPAVKSFDNLKRSSGAASASAISFGRIIQDAPFGIIGVANNIQNFGEQFVALGGKTATAGQKLSMFFSALITPANLAILAVSALTAGYQAYALGLFDSEDKTKDVISETERFSESLNNVIKSLNGVDSARLKANKSAAEELSEVELLNSVLTDTSKSENERLIVYNKLLEKYPKIIGNITQEKAITEGLGEAYKLLVSSIEERTKIDAISDSFTDAQKERIDLIVKERKETLLQNELYAKKSELLNNITSLSKSNNNATARGTTSTTGFSLALSRNQAELALVNEQISLLGNVSMKATEKALQENSGTINILKEQYGGLNQALADLSDGEPDENINRTTESLSQLNDSLTILGKQKENFFGEELAKFFATSKERIQGLVGPVQGSSMIYTENVEAMIQKNREFEEALNSIGLTSAQVFQAIANGAAEGYGSFNEFITDLATTQQFFNEAFQALEAGIENTIGDVAFAIGESLGNGGNALQAGGAALLGGISSILNQLGQMAITAGLALEAVKTSLETLRPELAIAAGIALIGIAGYVSSQSKKIGGKIGGGGGGGLSAGTGSTFTNRREFGGPVSKGRAYIVGEKRPELFVPNTSGIILPKVPSMDYSGASMSAGAMQIDVNIQGVSYGDDILFTVQQAQIRRGVR